MLYVFMEGSCASRSCLSRITILILVQYSQGISSLSLLVALGICVDKTVIALMDAIIEIPEAHETCNLSPFFDVRYPHAWCLQS